MKLTSKKNRITVRLDNDLSQSLNIIQQATKTGKAKIVRMILLDFFNKNETLLNDYYEKIKTQ